MPNMNGLAFLDKLMRLHPLPVVMVSTLTTKGASETLLALELGAVDFVAKPEMGIRGGMREYGDVIAHKIRAAACSRPRRQQERKPRAMLREPLVSSEKLVILGASTGGPEAIRAVLEPLPPNSPAILITQHMPAGFTHSFAQRLNRLCRMTVKEAEDGERVLPGHTYVAPGDRHLKLARNGANYVVELDSGPPVNRHKPSVDVLFHSAAKHAGRNAVGVLLTGMGKDGAAGLLAMRDAGAATLAQDEETCLVFGMPREAIALGGASEVLGLEDMAPRLMALAAASGRAQRV
ncbi:MAG TPA: chemotaxis response regulator protein-glutamate methylesterase, partial [Rhodanobacteraceae bacterium]